MKNFIYGFHAIEEFLKRERPAGKLLVSGKSKRIIPLLELARTRQVQVVMVSGAELDQMCDPKRHKGLILIPSIEYKSIIKEDYKDKLRQIQKPNPLVLLLDEITDPHNLGAILRSCDQFYVDLVVLTERKAAHESEVVSAASSGANIYVEKLITSNLIPVIEFMKKGGYWIYGADMAGKAAHTIDITGKVGLVLGSEGKGIRRLVKENCDQLVQIPAQGHIDSFNVSVAAGILLYEIRRQQQFI